MTPGQELAREELREIEAASQGAFEVLSFRPPDENCRSAIAEISVACSDMPQAEGGIKLRHRERFQIFIPPDFPFEIPRTYTTHQRFAGFPHVQWQKHLCLYQSSSTEWDASDGMFGFISRLELWLRRAALNQLDIEGAPLHPPAMYPTEKILVIPRKDTPQVQGTAWFGFANLKLISGRRIDIEGWKRLAELDTQPTVGAAILLSKPLSWEYPAKAKMLLDQLEKNGVSRANTRLVMAIAADINPEDSDLFVIVGAPMRGIRGASELKQHLAVWLIKKEMVKGLRLMLNKYRPEEGFRAIGCEAERIMEEWFDLVDVAWCSVREDRPEIIIPRDSGTSMNVFRDRTIAIWGCGALGAPIAESVARAGAKKLILRDNGIVAPGILGRQPYLDEEIGFSKAHMLAKRLKQIRPDILVVESKHEDVRSTILESEDWTDGAEYVIDTTASMGVIEKLELRRKQSVRRIPVVSLVVGHRAHQGLVVVAGTIHSGGPVDVLRSAKIAACSKGYLEDYVDEFWPKEARTDVFQPEPGCSEATFLGSAADSVALTATMLNLAAADLKAMEEVSNQDSATAHFVTQPYAAPPGTPLHYKFGFQSDIVFEDPQSEYQIRISRAALSEMHACARRSARNCGERAETGGVLFGGRDNASRVIWVSEVIGPPPDSESSHDHFICGIHGVAEANEEKRCRTGGSVQYIGMWHTHPTQSPIPSGTDFLAMHKLVNTEEPSTSKHLLLILGSGPGQLLGLLSGFFFSKRDFIELETHGVLQRTIKISTIVPSRPQVALKQANNRYLVLSDMHFGTPESSVNDSRFCEALIDYMVSRAPWEEIVFNGDLLDVNLSTLTRAIEGGTWPDLNVPLFGFRQFVKELDTRMRSQASGKGLKDLTKKWIYVPGNHDYKIWDMLSSKVICEDVLASGKQMGSVPTPLMMDKWTGDESFFAGIFRPYYAQGQVVVEYPNHEILFGQEREKMVLTHGHYLDAKQTRFNDLSDHFCNSKTPQEIRNVRRRIFIETAQYQTVANAVSFTMGMRGLVNVIVGPDALGNKIKKVYNQIGSRLLSLFFPSEGRKGKRLSPKQLLNMEYYLEQFCQDVKLPRWFIFGHTHRQDRKTVGGIDVEVYNAGSCYIDRGMPITFVEVETDADGMPIIQLMCVDQSGKVKKAYFSE
jgi:integrative and conjugative element protein (TIGR02256 family)